MNPEWFQPPIGIPATGSDGWWEEVLAYRVTPRPKSKFKTVLNARELFGDGSGGTSTVTTRGRAAETGETCLELRVRHGIRDATLDENLDCLLDGGLRPARFTRSLTTAAGELCRHEEVDFLTSPLELPVASYPEVLLPFLMRWQPRDRAVRTAFAWTNDRFCARVYYEVRSAETVGVPAGRFRTHQIWLYPDINDWIALGSLLTRLAKPLLPRYSFWLEADPPYRVIRFEGPYGPPAAPEIVLELASEG